MRNNSHHHHNNKSQVGSRLIALAWLVTTLAGLALTSCGLLKSEPPPGALKTAQDTPSIPAFATTATSTPQLSPTPAPDVSGRLTGVTNSDETHLSLTLEMDSGETRVFILARQNPGVFVRRGKVVPQRAANPAALLVAAAVVKANVRVSYAGNQVQTLVVTGSDQLDRQLTVTTPLAPRATVTPAPQAAFKNAAGIVKQVTLQGRNLVLEITPDPNSSPAVTPTPTPAGTVWRFTFDPVAVPVWLVAEPQGTPSPATPREMPTPVPAGNAFDALKAQVGGWVTVGYYDTQPPTVAGVTVRVRGGAH